MRKVWVNGCFDIIHRGHIELFKYAKAQGDYLIVGLDEDDRVSASKGEARPVNKLEDRTFVLRSIKYIDEVVSFGSDRELEKQIEMASPDIMVVGDDWKNKKIIGGHLIDNKLYFKRLIGYSTTKIISGEISGK
jgi:rfaE bifunctional protein nucleotidyltransferase chain/domain